MQIYSAATAPALWGPAFFVLPHILIGGGMLFATARKKYWLRGTSGTVGLAIQGLAGALLFGFGTYSGVKNATETMACRAAPNSSQVQSTSGPVHVVERFYKPGYGYVRFNIGNQQFVTATDGAGNDCGYIKPLGSVILNLEGAKVRAQYRGSTVVSLASEE